MTEQEYKDLKKAIEAEFEQKRQELKKAEETQIFNLRVKYAKAHQKYKVGDVFTSKNGVSILIEEVSTFVFLVGNQLPCRKYTGTVLDSKGKPDKKGNKLTFLQDDEMV